MNRENNVGYGKLDEHIEGVLTDKELALDFYNGKYTEENLRSKYPDRYKRKRILDLYQEQLWTLLIPLLLEVTSNEVRKRIITEAVGDNEKDNYLKAVEDVGEGKSFDDITSEYSISLDNLRAILSILEEDTKKRQRESHDILVSQVKGDENKKGLEDQAFETAEKFFEMEEQQYKNPLTGLLSLRGFNRNFEREIDSFAQEAGENDVLAFVFFDIDNFKALNQQLTHDGADQVLKQIAQRMQDIFRSSDHLAHRSGDEFMILARTRNDLLDTFLEKLKLINKEKFKVTVKNEQGEEVVQEVEVGLTGGVCIMKKDDISTIGLAECNKRSEDACGYGKTKGKNQFVVFSESLYNDLDKMSDEEIREYFTNVIRIRLDRKLTEIQLEIEQEKNQQRLSLLLRKQKALEGLFEASLEEAICDYQLSKLERTGSEII